MNDYFVDVVELTMISCKCLSHLSFQILPAEKSKKPQGSHLQTRVEYLLKLLHTETKQKVGRFTCNSEAVSVQIHKMCTQVRDYACPVN